MQYWSRPGIVLTILVSRAQELLFPMPTLTRALRLHRYVHAFKMIADHFCRQLVGSEATSICVWSKRKGSRLAAMYITALVVGC